MDWGMPLFGLSGAIVREDFRRFYAIPLIAFFGYLVSGLSVILFSYRVDYSANDQTANRMADFISHLLNGNYIVYALITAMVPIVTVCLIFRYLFYTGSLSVVHAQPFTRRTLLSSHTLSAVLFCLLPIAGTGICLMLLSHPVYYAKSWYGSSSEMVNLFTIDNVLQWMGESAVSSLFILSIAIFSAMVAGTAFHQIIAAIGFNVTFPLIAGLQSLYLNQYLVGFSSSGSGFGEFISSFSPLLRQFREQAMTASSILIYLTVTVIFYLLSAHLYSIRRLEDTSKGIMFPAIDYFITFIFGYIGMTTVGMVGKELFSMSSLLTTFAYAVGAFLGILVCRMFSMRSFDIINEKTLRIMGVYGICAALFFTGMLTDVTGYETRLPSEAKTASVQFSDDLTFIHSEEKTTTLTDDAAIRRLESLQRMIVRNGSKCIQSSLENGTQGQDGELLSEVHARYYSGTAGNDTEPVQVRTYTLPSYILLTSSEMKKLIENESFRQSWIDQIPAEDSISRITLTDSDPTDESSILLNEEEYPQVITDAESIRGLRNALEEDFQSLTYENYQRSYDREPAVYLKLFASGQSGEKTSSIQISHSSEKTIRVPVCFTSTLTWLKENGYSDWSTSYGADISAVAVYRVRSGGATDGYLSSETFRKSGSSMVRLEDIREYGSKDLVSIVNDPDKVQDNYRAAISCSVVGALDEISTEQDEIYYMEFYSHSAGIYYRSAGTGYIRKEELNQ